jgi:hypothetical protein
VLRPAAFVLPFALAGVLAAPAAAADTTWSRVSTVNAANVDNELRMVLVGARVVGAWTLNVESGYSPEIIAFDPTRTNDAANLVTASRPPAADLWAAQDLTLMPTAAGGVDLVLSGARLNEVGDPTAGTSTFPVNPADGTIGAQAVRTTAQSAGGDLVAVPLADGTPLFAYMYLSALYLSRPGAENFVKLTGEADSPVPGGNGYNPVLGRDAAGRYWLALYSNTAGAQGLYVAQLDPATGALLGPAVRAPSSEAVDNNRIDQTTLACAATCRLIYQGTAADGVLTDGRLLSWAVGEASPTVVTTGLERSLYSTAAYRADGRLWVAWDSAAPGGGSTFFAKLGDATGAGGAALPAGRPPEDPTGGASSLSSVAVGPDLVLATMWAVTGKSAQFVNLVAEPPPLTDGIPNPKVVTSPGGKLAFPSRVGADDVAKGCVPVRAVADKPARIWARIWTGRARNTGAPLSPRVQMTFARAGAKKVCLKLPRRAKGFYQGKPYRIVFEVRTGAVAKPAERTRPPWRTQPALAIDG